MKRRKDKKAEYQNKFSHIPIDYNERISWMYDYYKINEKKANEILQIRSQMVQSLQYYDLNIVLFEIPEGSHRPRFRVINRKNFTAAAKQMSQFVHVYTPNAKDDYLHMKRLTNEDLVHLDQLICTPCIIEYNTYHKTPSAYNAIDTFIAEIGIDRPTTKPDWDNIGKKYCDMSNHNLWLDDSLVISGTVNKYYSILPRIEIKIRYLNMLYNKHQYKKITSRKDFQQFNCNIDHFKKQLL